MGKKYKKCKIEMVDELNTGIEIKFTDFEVKEKEKYNRAKKKQRDRIDIEKGYISWEDKEND